MEVFQEATQILETEKIQKHCFGLTFQQEMALEGPYESHPMDNLKTEWFSTVAFLSIRMQYRTRVFFSALSFRQPLL